MAFRCAALRHCACKRGELAYLNRVHGPHDFCRISCKYAVRSLPIVYQTLRILKKIASIGANAMSGIPITAAQTNTTQSPPRDEKLRTAATNLEAEFLTEMLKHTGLGKSRESMGGGIGEDQFSSFLVREQANAMAKHGGIGLAETLFEALKKGQDNGQ
jgi:hypothetical protein